jgi:hypothetical protein
LRQTRRAIELGEALQYQLMEKDEQPIEASNTDRFEDLVKLPPEELIRRYREVVSGKFDIVSGG